MIESNFIYLIFQHEIHSPFSTVTDKILVPTYSRSCRKQDLLLRRQKILPTSAQHDAIAVILSFIFY